MQLGTQVFDITAQAHPIPYPNKAGGVFPPRYPVNYRHGAPRLIYCQDRDHVPLPVESVFFKGNFITAPEAELPWGRRTFPRIGLYDLRRSERFRRIGPLADALAGTSWSFVDRRVDHDVTEILFEDRLRRRARVRCIYLDAMPQKLRRMVQVCDTDVAVGDTVAYIQFRPSKTDPKAYPLLLHTAAKALRDLSSVGRQP